MDFDNEHRKHLGGYIQELEALYQMLLVQVAMLVVRLRLKDTFFSFGQYRIKKQAEKLLSTYRQKMQDIIFIGTANQWQFANQKNGRFALAYTRENRPTHW